ncbi:MAG: hypothetical protein QM713_12585 [Arachnia sp.]
MRDVTEINEADLVEQLIPVDPADEVVEPDGGADDLVDEADWLDQQVEVPANDPEG